MDLSTLKSQVEEIATEQGTALHPVEESETGPGAIYPKNPSGAQWRKIRRELAKDKAKNERIESHGPTPEQSSGARHGRLTKQRQVVEATSTPSPSSTAKGKIPSPKTPAKGHKGKRSRPSKDSSDITPKSKKVKRDTEPQKAGRSYASAVSDLPKVNLQLENHIEGRMPDDVCGKIRDAVTNRIREMMEGDGNFIPCFEDSYPKRGIFTFD